MSSCTVQRSPQRGAVFINFVFTFSNCTIPTYLGKRPHSRWPCVSRGPRHSAQASSDGGWLSTQCPCARGHGTPLRSVAPAFERSIRSEELPSTPLSSHQHVHLPTYGVVRVQYINFRTCQRSECLIGPSRENRADGDGHKGQRERIAGERGSSRAARHR